jgi:hypothetical protein
MNKDQILEKVAELVGIRFSTPKTQKFAQVELEGGFIITNQSEEDFVVNDTIYLVNDDGTFSIVGAGTWKYLDGEKILTTDEEGNLTEIKSGEDLEDETAEEIANEDEVSIDTDLEMEDETEGITRDEAIVGAIVEALLPMMEEMKKVQEEMAKLKKDYETFKKQGTHAPLKDDQVVKNAFATDERYEILKAMKESRRYK